MEFSLNGDGDDCNNEYLEILDGEEGDAISIGKYDFSSVNPSIYVFILLIFIRLAAPGVFCNENEKTFLFADSVETQHLEISLQAHRQFRLGHLNNINSYI